MKSLVVVMLALSTAAVSSAKVGIDVGLKIGSLGYGAEVTKTVWNKVDARAGLVFASYKMDGKIESKELDYTSDFKLSSWSLLADYHVFDGGFYVSGGFMGNNNKIESTVSPIAARSIGSRTYSVADQGSLTANITWPSIAPYIGIGFGRQQKNNSNFVVDVGAMFQGSPKVTMTGTGMIAPSASNAGNLESDLSGAKTWLVVNVGYRFGL